MYVIPEKFLWIQGQTRETTGPGYTGQANDVLSPAFSLSNGTRQGCPLSPLILVLALEPLLCRIRSHPDARGLRSLNTHHKVAAYTWHNHYGWVINRWHTISDLGASSQDLPLCISAMLALWTRTRHVVAHLLVVLPRTTLLRGWKTVDS